MPNAKLPLIVEPDQLEQAMDTENLLVVDLSNAEVHAEYRVPGAVYLAYELLVRAEPPAMGLLPFDTQLSKALSSIGLTPDTHVVAYDNEANGRAARLLWTLDVIGHNHFSLLNGGMQAWIDEGRSTEPGDKPSAHQIGGVSSTPEAGSASSTRQPYNAARLVGAVADKSYILDHLHDPGVVILDTRSPAEFAGRDRRAARGGHIPGAVNMDWTLTMDRTRNLRFKPEEELRQMLEALDITPDRQVIVHCQTHHRSSHTYVVLKSLGYERVKGYDGSWSEWGNDPDLPIET